MVAYSLLQASLETLESAAPEIDGTALIEIHTLLALVERWQNHPDIDALIHVLSLREEYPHTSLLLSFASYLEDAGNVVEFVPTASERTPDLRLRFGYWDWMNLEVKAPMALFRPRQPIGSADQAYNLIAQTVKKARTGSRGQLARAHRGVLVIGGFYYDRSSVNLLATEAERYLAYAQHVGKHKHLEAIQIVNFTVQVDPMHVDGVEARGLILSRVVRHPGFVGRSSIETSGPSLNEVRGPLSELTDVHIDIRTGKVMPDDRTR